MNREPITKQEIITAGLLLASAVLLFWWRIWAPSMVDRMHFAGDILIKDYPTRLGLFRLWVSGHLPLWDPYQFGGWPGWANCEAGLLYPFNWLLIPFVNDPLTAFQVTQWTVLLHFWIAGMSAYWLARRVGLSPLGAGMAMIAYAFCGFHCAHKQHTNMFYTLVWFPLVLLHVEYWIRERQKSALLWLTLLLALAYAAGHPQASLYITLIVAARIGFYAFAEPLGKDPLFTLFQSLLPAVLAIVLALALLAVQWVPLWGLIQQGERASADTFQQSTEFSLPPLELTDIILPEVVPTAVEIFYWGVTPLLLAIMALYLVRLDVFDRFMLGLGLFALLISMGGFLFLYDLSYVLLPGVAWVRAPSRWIYFASLPVALLAGRMIDWFIHTQMDENELATSTIRRITLGWFGVLFAASIVLALIYKEQISQKLAYTLMVQGLLSALLLLAVFMFMYKRISVYSLIILAVMLTWLDLGTHYRTLDLKPGPGGYPVNDTVELLHEADWNHRTKVFLGAGGIRDAYHGAAQAFYELDGNSPLTPLLNLQLREDTSIALPSSYNAELLKMAGVGAIISDHEALAAPFTKYDKNLFVNDKPVVRARVYSEFFLMNEDAQRDALKLQSFPFEKVLIRSPKSVDNAEESEPGDEIDENGTEINNRFFNKPFLLASSSKRALKPQALLIVDGENHFEDFGNESGYYLAQADPQTGEIERKLQLNLMASYEESENPGHENLKQFIDSVPEGKTVFAALADNAANVLLAEGLAAFRQIGAKLDVRTGYQTAHLIIGQKGAPVGSAVEIVSSTEALMLQTDKHLWYEGEQTQELKIEFHRIHSDIDDWMNFLDEINPAGIQYADHDHAININQPVVVYSSQKQEYDINTSLWDDQASIKVGGVDYSLNDVGYNLILLNPENGEVVARDSFNLLEDYVPDPWNPAQGKVKNPPPENRAMQQFIKSATQGHIIIGAIRDEATDLMLPETYQSLLDLGSELPLNLNDPRQRKGFSHAFIAVKGASGFVETFSQSQDVLLISRAVGGPMLRPEDLSRSASAYDALDPLEEFHKSTEQRENRVMSPPPVWSVQSESPNRLVVSGMSDNGGILLLNEIYNSGWVASLSGFDVPVERVNYYFRGVQVPPGGHVVEFLYEPAGFQLGLAISIAALLVYVLWIVWLRMQ